MQECPFCDIVAGRVDADLVAFRTDRTVVVPALKQRRRNRGHMLILPVAHVTRLADADGPLLQELYAVVGRVSLAARAAFGATGTTTFRNECAPDQLLHHLHIHVVPRGPGDDFRMPDPTSEPLGHEERRSQALALGRSLR